MRLAADSARRVVEDLTAQRSFARRNAVTNSLVEVVAGGHGSGRKTRGLTGPSASMTAIDLMDASDGELDTPGHGWGRSE